MDLLAAEITARTDKDPGEHYRDLVAEGNALVVRHVDHGEIHGYGADDGSALAAHQHVPRVRKTP